MVDSRQMEYKKILRARKRSILQKTPIDIPIVRLEQELDDYCQDWHDVPATTSYTFIPRHIYERYSNLSRKSGLSHADLHKCTMIRFMERYDNGHAEELRLTAEIKQLTRIQFLRILHDFGKNDDIFYNFNNDLFQKDLGIVNGRLWPCHARLLKYCPGVPRRLLFTHGVRQFLRALRFFLLDSRKFGPSFEVHVHLSMLEEFSPQGWERCLRAASEMLLQYPEVKLFQGSAWFYDPVIETISPRLGYNRQIPMSGGAQIFYGGENPVATSSALAKSQTRRHLYEEGRYHPATYYLLWSRRKMLHWYRTGKDI